MTDDYQTIEAAARALMLALDARGVPHDIERAPAESVVFRGDGWAAHLYHIPVVGWRVQVRRPHGSRVITHAIDGHGWVERAAAIITVAA